MHKFLTFFTILPCLQALLWADPLPGNVATPEPSLRQQYLGIYLKINDAYRLEKNGEDEGALHEFLECYRNLATIHFSAPSWEDALVLSRLKDCRSKIIEINNLQGGKAKLDQLLAGPYTLDASSPLQTSNFSGGIVSIDVRKLPRNKYPWKTNVIASFFWIGKDTKNASAWDPNWKQHNNGEDSPEERSGYFPAKHTSTLNPFYVALPFDDLAYPDKAQKWTPANWRRPDKNGKHISSCKDRWVEIKDAHGRACYAQWEDAGPSRSDEAEYVFGSSAPDSALRPGICVSPAVSDYLNLKGANSIIQWRFVDDFDVAPGKWLTYDERALIFAAMLESKKSSEPSTR